MTRLCKSPSPWALGCPTGETQVADPWLTLASCWQALTASSTGQKAGNTWDLKTNKVTHTTALLRAMHTERVGGSGVGWLQGVVVIKIARCPAMLRLQIQKGSSICVIFKEQNVTEQWSCSRRISNRVRCKVTPKPDRFLKTDDVVNGNDTYAAALKSYTKLLRNSLLAAN